MTRVLSSERRPNIVFIMTDQQRYDTVRAFGFAHVDTPNLDRLAQEGTWFSHCYATGASCVPSRASLFNGLYPHTLGVLDNASTWRRSWVERLAAVGYTCASIGKMHTQPMDAPAGFHHRLVVENKDRSMAKRGRDFVDAWDEALQAAGHPKPGLPSYRLLPDYADRMGAYDWPLPEAMHADAFVGRSSVEWIGNRAGTQEPFFLQVGFPGPHPPYDPPPQWSALYEFRDLPILPVMDADLDGQPPPFVALRDKHAHGHHDAAPHQIRAGAALRRRQRAHYLGNVSLIDQQVGRIMEALTHCGKVNDTVIVFTSDHGDCLGDHGHLQKWNFYEQSIRVPLIVSAPGLLTGRGEVSSLVQCFDVVPALLTMAGIEAPTWFETRTLLPALHGQPFPGRDAVYSEQGRDVVFQFADFVSMVRTQRWKLVHFMGEHFGQLFDLDQDPLENQDLWWKPEFRQPREELIRMLYEWRLKSAYETREWTDTFR